MLQIYCNKIKISKINQEVQIFWRYDILRSRINLDAAGQDIFRFIILNPVCWVWKSTAVTDMNYWH